MDGILNLNKPCGWSSHDAVALVRRLIRQKRVGHAGTLDPLATGVLLICIGQATRVAEYLMASGKVYLARLRLGATTSTYDSAGEVTETRDVQVSEAALQAALQQFLGETRQVPPMYSALKRGGQPLYKLARRGLEVERAARPIHIERIVLRQVQLPDVTIEVHCSSGTYIRSLAHDIGQALGCGAHLTALVRQASGAFRLDDALDPAALEAAVGAGRLADRLYPVDAALQALPAIQLDQDTARRVRQGQLVPLTLPPAPASRAYDAQGALAAVLVYDAGTGAWRPDKVFQPG